jgi:hypothetical protein
MSYEAFGIFIAMLLCTFGLGWSLASVYQLTRFRKKWSDMAKRGRELDERVEAFKDRLEKLEYRK